MQGQLRNQWCAWPVLIMVALAVALLTGAPIASAEIKPKEVDAYQETFDVSRAEARDRLEVQSEGTEADIVGGLEQKLDENFAGVWFDNASGEFVVPTTPGADRGAVSNELTNAQLGGDYRSPTVEYSWEELEAAQQQVNGELRDLIEAGKVQTSLDPRTNAVIVEVAEASSAQNSAMLKRIAIKSAVNVELRDKDTARFHAKALSCRPFFLEKYCDIPLRGGVGIEEHEEGLPIRTCTAAFRARGDTNGKRYLLTAGHCIDSPSAESPPFLEWDSADSLQNPHYIGEVEQHTYPTHDWAKIDATGSYWDVAPWPSSVVYWGENTGTVIEENYPINGEASSYLFETVCHSGASTGTSCGTVTGLNQTVYFEGDGWLIGMNRVLNGCAYGGDSGGPVFASNMALGMLSGGEVDEEHICSGPEWYYGNITEATAALNVHIATAAPSQTSVNITPLQCPAGSVMVGGTVSSDGHPVRYGQVRIDLSKWEGSQWVFKESVLANVGNGTYQAQANPGAGQWRAKATLLASNGLASSESGYKELFTNSVSIDENDGSGGPRAVFQCKGTADAFYRDVNGSLGHQWWTQASGWASETRPAAIAASSVPRAIAHGNGTVDVFYRDVNGNLGHQWWAQASGWASETRSAAMASDPHVVTQPNGTVDIFYRDTNGNLGHQWWTQANGWGAETRPAVMATDPAVTAQANGKVEIYYRDVNGNLGHQWWTPTTGWGSETRAASMASAPQVTTQPNGTVDVFYRDVNGNLGHQWWSPTTGWATETRTASIAPSSTPRAIAQQNGTVDVFYRDVNGSLGHQWWTPYSGWASETRTASMASEPHITAQLNGTVDVFYRDTNGNLGHQWWTPSSGWASETRTALMASDPHIIAQANGTVDVFYRDTSGNLGHQWWTQASGWASETRPASIAARPPIALTGPATNVEDHSAKLYAEVNPQGEYTYYYFEYGLSPSYGSKQPVAPADVGTYDGPISLAQPVGELAEGVVYHYRVVAFSSEGISYGKDMTFATSNIRGQLSGLAVVEPFDGSSSSLANFSSNWSALGWAAGTGAKGEDTSTGWRPVNAYPTVNGAYIKTNVNDSGSGVAAVATLAHSPSGISCYFSLWLDATGAGASRAGYELRFTETATNIYEAKLSKWQAGTQTVLGSKSGYSLAQGSSVALVDGGATVSARVDTGSGFSQLLAASDSSFSGGSVGLEGSGNITRLTNFKAGTLPPPLTAPQGRWYLRNATTSGIADIEFNYGGAELIPVAGDWNGDGIDTPGAYNKITGQWFLRNSNTGGNGEINFTYGGGGELLPVVGDWNKDGIDTPGLYKPSTGQWFLRNSNTTGAGEVNFVYGGGSDTLPIAGDWNNDGTDTIGIVDPDPVAADKWFLRNSNTAGGGEINFTFGSTLSLVPLVGDWNNDGIDTAGFYKPTTGEWYLRNFNTTGGGEINPIYGGGSTTKPVIGDWNKDGTDTIGVVN